MVDEELIETTVTSEVVHRGGYLTVRVDTLIDATGERHRRDIVEHPGAVAILALDGEDLLMVRQFRAPVGRVLLELPAGTLDRLEDGAVEDPGVAARRELTEETGQEAREWRLLGSFYTAPGFTDEHMSLFLARDLSLSEGHTGPGADERLRVERLPWRRALALAEEGAIEDAKTLVGLFRLARLADAGELG